MAAVRPHFTLTSQKFKNEKGPGTSFQTIFFTEFFDKKFRFEILHKLPNRVYFSSYSVKRVLYFMIGHLMTP